MSPRAATQTDRERSPWRLLAMWCTVLSGAIVAVVIIFIIALHASAVKQVDSSVAACLGQGSVTRIVSVNNARDDSVGNFAIAADPGQPRRTRVARRIEARDEARNVLILDARIDASLWSQLRNKIDQDAVRYGVRYQLPSGKAARERPFSCAGVYPVPPLL